jgi:hypothetical protein
LGLGLTDKLPDASTLSQNRIRRFNETGVYQQIFDQIVLQAMKKKLVGGTTLYTDSTHLKANANKNKHILSKVHTERQAYMDDLDRAVDEDRLSHGKKPLAPSSKAPPEREIKQSTTDPGSGYMVRDSKSKGFFYLDHRTVDSRCNIVTDVHVTAGNVHDAVLYIERLDRQKKRLDFDVKHVYLDAGYFTPALCKDLEVRDIYAVMGYRRSTYKAGYFYKREYTYDDENDQYTCPVGQIIIYKTTSREGYSHYQSNPTVCVNCPLIERCTRSANKVKTITRHA